MYSVALARAVVDFAHLEVEVFAAQYLGLPAPVEVVNGCPGAHLYRAILLADVLELYCGHLVE